MAASGVLLGILAKLYLNSGTYGSPTWAEVKLVGDMTVNQARNTATVVTRASLMEYEAATTFKVSLSGKLRADLTDTQYLAIMAAFAAGSVINVMALSGDKTANGAQGWMFDCQVKQMNEDQAAGNAIFDDFELVPYPSANPAQHALVTTGAPVFTAV
jgi:hypothetical protein